MKKVIQLLCSLAIVLSGLVTFTDIYANEDFGRIGIGISEEYVDIDEEIILYFYLEYPENYKSLVVTLFGADDLTYDVYCDINEYGYYEGRFSDFNEDDYGEWFVYNIMLTDHNNESIIIMNSMFENVGDYQRDFSYISFVVTENSQEISLYDIYTNKKTIEVDEDIIFYIDTLHNEDIESCCITIEDPVLHTQHEIYCYNNEDNLLEGRFNTDKTLSNGIWKVISVELYDHKYNPYLYIDADYEDLYIDYEYTVTDFSELDFEVTMCSNNEGVHFYHNEIIMNVDEAYLNFLYDGLELVEDYYFESADSNIATVNQDGVITGIKDGETHIHAYDSNDNKLASCKVIVCEHSIDVYTGQSAEISFYLSNNLDITPESAYDRFASAYVSGAGMVFVNGGLYYQKTLTVQGNHYGITYIEVKNIFGNTLEDGRIKVNVIDETDSIESVTRRGVEVNVETYHDEEIDIISYEDLTIGDVVSKKKTSNGKYIYTIELGIILEGEDYVQINGSQSGLIRTYNITSYEIDSITLSPSSVRLKVNETYTLDYTTTPLQANIEQLYFESSNEDVVSVERGILTAKSPGKAIITVSTLTCLTSTCEVTVTNDKKSFPFTDVSEKQWYYGVINEAYQLGLLTGATETLFKPNANMNRAMVACVFHRMEGNKKVEYTNVFSDVKDGQYYTTSVMWAKQSGVINGYKNGTYKPLKNISREEMATMIYNFAKYKGLSIMSDKDITQYSDYKDITPYARVTLQWAVENGLMSGKYNGTKLDPLGLTTRAEASKMLVNAYKLIYK